MRTEQAIINELLFRLLDNEITDQDFARLKNWVNSDPAAKDYYCRFMTDYSTLSMRPITGIQEADSLFLQEELLDRNFWTLMSEEEESAPGIEPSAAPPVQAAPIAKVHRSRVVRTVNKTSLAVAVASMAALCLLVCYVHLSGPAPYEVATLVDCMDAEWSSDLRLRPGARICSNIKPIRLTGGIVKLVTDDNVQVVLEAPTEFHFVSYSEIALGYGKLFANVSEQGRGFLVAAPNARIVDLGTEFSVLSHLDGNTEVHMYKGTANLFSGHKNEIKTSQILSAGSARQIERADSTVREIALQRDLVVRQIDSTAAFAWRGQPLDLADIVGGGSGFGTGRLDRGLDPLSGRTVESLRTTDVYAAPAGYLRAVENAFIDGVFVPANAQAASQITSTGLVANFPRTSGKVWGYVFNGAWHESFDAPHHNLQLDGKILDGRNNPAIAMHSNLGITYDLAAIRRSLPQLRIKSFCASYGISETVDNWLKAAAFEGATASLEFDRLAAVRRSAAEFWVFLDGKNVLHDRRLSGGKSGSLNIPIDDGARFLTLAVTESDDTFMFDWAVFVQPELNLELTGK